jgi:hypothetical protein
MVETALTDFRALEMVLHANLAEQFLRNDREARKKVVGWRSETHRCDRGKDVLPN